MTSRRGFLGSILALAASPAIVRAESLMPVAPPIWVPPAGLTIPLSEHPGAFRFYGSALGTYPPLVVDGLDIGPAVRQLAQQIEDDCIAALKAGAWFTIEGVPGRFKASEHRLGPAAVRLNAYGKRGMLPPGWTRR